MRYRPVLLKFGLIIMGYWLVGCSTAITQQAEQISVERFDSLRSTYYHLNDSLNYAWTAVKQSDEQKLLYLNELLDELTHKSLIGSDTLALLEQMVQKLRASRFDSVTMANTRQIYQYDSLTGQLSDSLLSLTDRIIEVTDNPRLLYLTDKIVSENSGVVLYRLHYDNVSQAFNRFIEENKELMSSLDSTDRPVIKRPMFKLVSDPPANQEPEKQ
ncbi:hypothetical protein [Tunicatimonas pelagia]|uniref:hypothetical protein n=1 Tax=Tunicatimonas pelagia TaxID=931531 RepID=UPI0026665A3F|nr:hypothetical protein [Tunicatimonas pelagia]WKN41471.1 hypothetical protein P0M28_20765 [Tunicatimonas pelagia]